MDGSDGDEDEDGGDECVYAAVEMGTAGMTVVAGFMLTVVLLVVMGVLAMVVTMVTVLATVVGMMVMKMLILMLSFLAGCFPSVPDLGAKGRAHLSPFLHQQDADLAFGQVLVSRGSIHFLAEVEQTTG